MAGDVRVRNLQPVHNGDDLDELQTGGVATEAAETQDLYPILDRRGALFVEADGLSETSLEQPVADGAYRSMRVNTNYLAQYPIVDARGAPVIVPADETDWVLLRPSELVLADEPTGALDAVNRDGILDLLTRLHEQGRTIIVVTHDPHVAAAANRIVTLGGNA